MLQPLGAPREVLEERARNVAMLFVLEASYQAIGGRRARVAAVRAVRLVAAAPVVPANEVAQ